MRNSMEEVINLQRFMDFLPSQPIVNAGQSACVGRDFGGM